MTDLEIYQRTKEIIKDRDTWTKGVMARDWKNQHVNVLDPDAVKFCLLGAMEKSLENEFVAHQHTTAYHKLLDLSGLKMLSALNDEVGFEAVHRLLDKAIEKEKSHVTS